MRFELSLLLTKTTSLFYASVQIVAQLCLVMFKLDISTEKSYTHYYIDITTYIITEN